MRRPAATGPTSRTEQLARRAVALPPPPGVSPLRYRLLRLMLTPDGGPCPERMAALRDMSLREALELEAVAHTRQREALLLQDAMQDEREQQREREAAHRARARR